MFYYHVSMEVRVAEWNMILMPNNLTGTCAGTYVRTDINVGMVTGASLAHSRMLRVIYLVLKVHDPCLACIGWQATKLCFSMQKLQMASNLSTSNYVSTTHLLMHVHMHGKASRTRRALPH